jgi:K+-sensing histidine kinase KdpD
MRQEGHMGLGLYVAKLITEGHGGNISAHNNYSPEGAEFSVRLPCL